MGGGGGGCVEEVPTSEQVERSDGHVIVEGLITYTGRVGRAVEQLLNPAKEVCLLRA